MRTTAWETAPQIALRNCSKKAGQGGQHVHGFDEGAVCSQSRYFFFFAEGFCYSWGAIITMKDFSAFLDIRRYKNWVCKIGSWKNLSEDLSYQFFPEHGVLPFFSPPWSFRECWKPAAAVALDLSLMVVDGNCQWQVPTCSCLEEGMWHSGYTQSRGGWLLRLKSWLSSSYHAHDLSY